MLFRSVWSAPAAIAVTPEVRLGTAVGTRCCVVVLSPNWPLPLPPQHCTAPALVNAQVWKVPAAIAVTPEVRPETAVGTRRCVMVLSPNWPLPLTPQHCTAPALVNAQVWLVPAAIAVTPEVRLGTAVGTMRFVVVLSRSEERRVGKEC